MYLVLSDFDPYYDKQHDSLILLSYQTLLSKQKQELNCAGISYAYNSDIKYTKHEAEYYTERVINLYRRIIKSISSSLNEYNCVDHGERFWTIAVGRKVWETIVTYLLYYKQIKMVSKEYINLKTTIMNHEDSFFDTFENHYYFVLWRYLVPSTLISSIDFGIDYNLASITMRSDYPIISDNTEDKISTLTKIKRDLYRVFFLAGNKTEIILDTPYVPNMKELTLTSGFRIKETTEVFNDLYIKYESRVDKRISKPTSLNNFEYEDELERVISENIFYYIPDIFTDKFEIIEESIYPLYSKCKAKVVGSANSYWYNDIYNLWAAHMSENGAKVISIEHGGPNVHDFVSDFECETFDWHMVMGNYTSFPRFSNVLPGMCIKQINNMNSPFSENARRRILFLEDIDRYLVHYISCFDFAGVDHRIDMRLCFYDYIGKSDESDLVIRHLNSEYNISNDYIDCYVEQYNNISSHSMNEVPYYIDIDSADICVVDSIQTVWGELLPIGKPTILLVDLEGDPLIDDAYDLVTRMKDCGLVFFDGKECARYLESIKNIQDWWHEKQRQGLIQEFCDKYSYLPDKKIRYKELAKRILAARN